MSEDVSYDSVSDFRVILEYLVIVIHFFQFRLACIHGSRDQICDLGMFECFDTPDDAAIEGMDILEVRDKTL